MKKNLLHTYCKEEYPASDEKQCSAKIEINIIGTAKYVSKAVAAIQELANFYREHNKG